MTWKIQFYCLLFCTSLLRAQAPSLVGYWHNWNDWSAPYIELDNVDSRYDIISLAFALPAPGTSYDMRFTPDQVSQAVLQQQIQTLQNEGRKVLISIGGATAQVSIESEAQRDIFISSMNQIIQEYGFDGIDIDLEGPSVTISGGTIQHPIDNKIIYLIQAIQQIMSDYWVTNNRKLLLTMAPETAFVQGGMSAFGGVWGAYLPIIHALRDSIDLLHVQLYNSGTMFGIDGNIYTQGTADFIVAMTEAVIQGFNTAGGFFEGLPANKVAVGLPACPSAAGGGYISPETVQTAMAYLLGTGPQPGTYTLSVPSGYPDLGGMMTWSINWDAVATCGDFYEFAANYELIFGSFLSVDLLTFDAYHKSGLQVHLSWETASEYDLVGFEVERALPGSAFETIDFVRAMAVPGAGASYRLLDDGLPRPGLYYYRLSSLHEDGAFEYTPIRAVVIPEAANELLLSPNPSTGQVHVRLNKALNGRAALRIMDMNGKIVYSREDLCQTECQNMTLFLDALEPGMYLVYLYSDQDTGYVSKLLLQR